MPIIIHHLHCSVSERVIWLCEELNVPYELKCYNRDPTTKLAPAEYKALSASQTSPVIQDGDITLAESGAVMEYIIQKHGGGRFMVKPSEPGYTDFLFWWHYAQGSLQPAIFMAMIGQMLVPGATTFAGVRKEIAVNAINDRLAESRYLAGEEITAADFMSLFYFTTSRMFSPMDLGAWPHVVRWVEEVGGRPAYVRALEKGDPGMKPMTSATGS